MAKFTYEPRTGLVEKVQYGLKIIGIGTVVFLMGGVSLMAVVRFGPRDDRAMNIMFWLLNVEPAGISTEIQTTPPPSANVENAQTEQVEAQQSETSPQTEGESVPQTLPVSDDLPPPNPVQ